MVGHRLVNKVENCTKDPVFGAELWNQFCTRKENYSNIIEYPQNDTIPDYFVCDEYFDENNVTEIRGVKGMASGILAENIKNNYYDAGHAIANSKNETEYNLGGKDPRSYTLVDKFTSWTILVGIFFPSVTGMVKSF